VTVKLPAVIHRATFVHDPEEDALFRAFLLSLPSLPIGDGRCTHSTARHASSTKCSQCAGVRVAVRHESREAVMEHIVTLSQRTRNHAATMAGMNLSGMDHTWNEKTK
jgi:hypothetical protein